MVQNRHLLALFAGPAWLVGVWLGDAADLPLLYWLLVGFIGAAGSAALWRRSQTALLLAALAALAFGAARTVSAQPAGQPPALRAYNGAPEATVIGLVIAEPQTTDASTRLTVRARQITTGGATRPAEGVLQVVTARFPEYGYGDEVVLAGPLAAPNVEEGSSYGRYLARRGVYSEMAFPFVTVRSTGGGSPLMRALLAVKDRARNAIQASIPEPQAALLAGILLGDDSGMTREMSDAFRATGMTHIIAISGFNIALLIALLDTLSAPLLPRKTAALTIMLFLGLYALLVGAAASVVRAAVMGAAALVALRLLGRPTLALAPLLIAAFLMTLVQPLTLWDIGFQLSFAATLGLILYAGSWSRPVQRRLDASLGPAAKPARAIVVEGLVVTLAAQALTLPLILYHFGRLPLASLPANLLVLPAQPGLMATGELATLAGMAVPALGRVLGVPAWLFLAYTEGVIQQLAALPWASVKIGLSAASMLAVYAVIGALTVAGKSGKAGATSDPPRAAWKKTQPYAAVGCVLLAVLAWVWAGARPDGRLHVTFLDVGQGDAILIETPDGRQALVDGGHFPNRLLEQLGDRLPVWDRSLDLVIASHPDSDHVAGLVEVLRRYEVGQLLTNGQPASVDPAYRTLLQVAEKEGVPVHVAQAGEAIRLDPEATLDVLQGAAAEPSDDDTNNASLVLSLRFGRFGALLTGDAEEAAEKALLAGGADLQSAVLKAAHHGSKTSSGEPFLAAVRPQFVVISVGADNRFGHPNAEMLGRAAAVGASVLRTDERGAIEVVSDGARFWIETER